MFSLLHKKIPYTLWYRGFFIERIRRRPTLPPSRPGSTIGAEELNCRDRNGNGCDLLAIATENRSLGTCRLANPTRRIRPWLACSTSAVLYADNKKSGRYQKPELDNSFLSSAFYIKNLDNRTVGGI